MSDHVVLKLMLTNNGYTYAPYCHVPVSYWTLFPPVIRDQNVHTQERETLLKSDPTVNEYHLASDAHRRVYNKDDCVLFPFDAKSSCIEFVRGHVVQHNVAESRVEVYVEATFQEKTTFDYKMCVYFISVWLDERSVFLCNWQACWANCRRAVLAWMLVAKRVGIYRDVAGLIARAVWSDRNEAEWEP